MINVSVTNSDIDDAFVKVWDENLPGFVDIGTTPPIFDARVNGNQSSPQFQIQEDGTGCGNIHWRATNANDPTRQQEGDKRPAPGEQVAVSAG